MLKLLQGSKVLRGEVVDSPRAKMERVERAMRELEAAVSDAFGPTARVVPVIYGTFGDGELPTPPAASHPVLRVVREAA